MLIFKPYHNMYLDTMFNTGLIVHAAILIVGPILLFAGIWIFEVIARHNDTSNERPSFSVSNSIDGGDILLGIYIWGSITIAPLIAGHIAWQWCNAHQFEYFEAHRRTMMPVETASNIMAIAMFLSPILWLGCGLLIALLCMTVFANVATFFKGLGWGISQATGRQLPGSYNKEQNDMLDQYDAMHKGKKG